jgi:hypothetical protein
MFAAAKATRKLMPVLRNTSSSAKVGEGAAIGGDVEPHPSGEGGGQSAFEEIAA